MKPQDKERLGLAVLTIVIAAVITSLALCTHSEPATIPPIDTIHEVVTDTVAPAPKPKKQAKKSKKIKPKTPKEPPRSHLDETF